MELSFEQLKSMVVFAHVAKNRSFSGAAAEIGLSRGVVSYHVKKLEQQLSVSLINRSTRRLSLTEAGQQYFQYCRVITEQASLAQQQIENTKDEPEGLLKLSCPVNVGLQLLVPALNQFKRLYPKIALEVSFNDDVVNLVEEGFDLAVRGAPLPDSTLHATKLATLNTGLFAAPEYIAEHGAPQTPQQLPEHQWVIYQTGAKTLQIQDDDRSYSIKPNGSISTNNAAARTAFVEGGHGIARIPLYDATPKVKQGTVVQLLSQYQFQPIEVYAVYAAGNTSTKKLRILLDHLKHYFQDKQ
ncbi:LysR family transcriptional regulator [Ferrimonas lipolytica]|uniref:LysR family transcriptional regulator n=1 Tax=Ferrimonas lipolytica TaxID=2724191 RepID=A0A6H1UCX9_9GAMM|nr:LysR family transcriptional regulator [Ferrimonas lipolytica]QIZ76894.1 LysR family transcriptional regulator [Ferrimonas lipolytica]